MKITEIRVRNYKSLRDVTWTPGQISVIVGANNSGKSNLADFFDFLSDVYTDGLSKAVVRKGGYENIAHRKSRRAKGGVAVEVHAETKGALRGGQSKMAKNSRYNTRFSHRFLFRAENESIMAEFKIVEEMITFEREVEGGWQNLLSIAREGRHLSGTCIKEKDHLEAADFFFEACLNSLVRENKFGFRSTPQNTEILFPNTTARLPLYASAYRRALASIQVLQINTAVAREAGVPISDQTIGRHGEQLPTVIDWLQQKKPPVWRQILGMMQSLMPDLERIEVNYTDRKERGLFFHEIGIGRPWRVDEISDGTIHSLAFLVGLFDPRPTMAVIEEPENSVHAWILRELMEEMREESETKQIVLTTHSPFVVDAVHPENVWVMWRENAESKIERFLDIDSKVKKSVLEGGLTTFDYLDTGAVRKAVPRAPSAEAAE